MGDGAGDQVQEPFRAVPPRPRSPSRTLASPRSLSSTVDCAPRRPPRSRTDFDWLRFVYSGVEGLGGCDGGARVAGRACRSNAAGMAPPGRLTGWWRAGDGSIGGVLGPRGSPPVGLLFPSGGPTCLGPDAHDDGTRMPTHIGRPAAAPHAPRAADFVPHVPVPAPDSLLGGGRVDVRRVRLDLLHSFWRGPRLARMPRIVTQHVWVMPGASCALVRSLWSELHAPDTDLSIFLPECLSCRLLTAKSTRR